MPMKVRTLLGMATDPIKPQNCPQFCLPRCRIGLEYEWEGAGKYPLQTTNTKIKPLYSRINEEINRYFQVKPDGSLRQDGVEFVLREPLSGNALLAAVGAMGELSRIGGYKASYRTSLHVHMDMQDMEYPRGAVAVACMYALMEPFMYKFIGRGRANSNYCIPWYESPQHYQVFLNIIKKTATAPRDYQQDKLIRAQQHKYSGMNVFSLGNLGTFEFRQAAVEMQVDKIIVWINLIMSLKKFVLEHPTWTPDYVYARASRMGMRETLANVFGEYAANPLALTKTPDADFVTGLNTLAHFIAILEEGE